MKGGGIVAMGLVFVAVSTGGARAQAPESADTPQLLAKAREAGRSATALAGPRLPASASKADSDRAMPGWGTWFGEKSRRVARAKQAYAAAARVATPLQKATLQREISEVLLAFFDEMYASLQSVSAPALRDANAQRILRRQVLGKSLPMLEHVQDDLTSCVRVAGAVPGDAEESGRCASLLAKVDKLFAEVDAEIEADDWRFLQVVSDDHQRPPARRTAPCELSGNLSLSFGEIYPTADARTASFDFAEIDVSRLAPATSRAGRSPVRVEWPVLADGWIDPAQLPFSLRRRIDVVKGRLWLGEGARISAYGVLNGKVTIVRPGAPPDAPGPEPDGVEREVGCDAIGLPEPRTTGTPEKGRPGALSGTIQLFDAPNGRPVATLRIGDAHPAFGPFIVRVLDERAGFTRIMKLNAQNDLHSASYLPFDFDGWIKGPVSSREPGGSIFGRDSGAPPTHRATAEAALRREPRAAAPVVARMAKGAPFVTGRTSGGFVAVKLPGIGGDGLWLAQSELATAATPVPRPADPPPPETARERRRRLTDIPVSATAGVP